MQSIEEVLAVLLDTFNLQIEPERVRAVKHDVFGGFVDEEQWSWREYTKLIAERVGLRIHNVSLSLKELMENPDWFPVFTYIERDGEEHWCLLLKVERGRFFVADITGNERWCTLTECATMLGIPKDTTHNWCTAEVLKPLEIINRGAHKEDKEEKSFWDVWPKVRRLLWLERRELINVVLYAMAIGLLTLVTPIAVQALVNTVAFGTLLQPLFVLSLMLAAGLSFLSFMQGIQIYLVELICRRVFVRVVQDFSYRLPRSTEKARAKHDPGELPNYFFDVLSVQKVLAVLLFDSLSGVLSIASGMLLLALYHPYLLVFDALFFVSVLALIWVLGHGAVKTSVKESKSKHKVGAWLDALVRRPLLFKSNGGFDFASDRSDTLVREYLVSRRAHFSIVMRQVIGGLVIVVVTNTLLLVVGGYLVISNELTLGQLVAAELVMSVMLASLFKIVKAFEKVYDLYASVDKLSKISALELERDTGTPQSPGSGPLSVTFSDLPWAGSESGQDGLYVHAHPGERVAFLGDPYQHRYISDALFGLQALPRGMVQIGELQIKEWKIGDLRRDVVLLREPEWFEGTIFENIRVGRKNVYRRHIRAILQKVGMLDAVLAQPNGLDTRLNEELPFSMAQMSLLTLARALVGCPRVLVLDGFLDRFGEDALCALWERCFSDFDGTILLMSHHKVLPFHVDMTVSLDAFVSAPSVETELVNENESDQTTSGGQARA